METDSETLSTREKLQALRRVARYRPKYIVGLVTLGTFVAFLEGVGLGFIYPIIETAQAEDPTNVSGPVMEAFINVYQTLNIPFSLGYLIIGVATIITARYTLSFLVRWLGASLGKQHEKHLRSRGYRHALNGKINYFDEEGSDRILNAIITETKNSSKVIRSGITTVETVSLIMIYAGVMFYIAPSMTVSAVLILGILTGSIRFVIEPAYTVGSRLAEANERVQETVQAGTQGIREVKLFGLMPEMMSEFDKSVDNQTRSSIRIIRNKVGIRNFFELSAAMVIFGLVYFGFTFTGLTLEELGIFLVAMFQLAPKISVLNSKIYDVESGLSHLVRTYGFFDELSAQKETSGDQPVSQITTIRYNCVHFSYDEDEKVLDGISFDISKGEFIAFVGQSGAGKSTIVSLLARFYDPDRGEIRADGVPINEFDIKEWRERIAVVRQNPYIFTDSLENNVTIANRDASRKDVERACEIAKVDEFVDDLPNGYESQLGDNGVRLSGGQRQRVSLARALLKDADFLVLDEATSDLDSNIEDQVQSNIESMEQEYGIITIAHRLSTVKNADRIYTVDNGRITESGTHRELLDQDGEYANLYSVQSTA